MTEADRLAAAAMRQAVLGEIRTTWGKFSDRDLTALKDNDDLVRQLAAKYDFDQTKARFDVDALLKGRRI